LGLSAVEDKPEKLVKSTDGLISRAINRKISSRISRWIVNKRIPLTPNQVTLMSFLISLIPFPLYVLGYPRFAGVFVQVASIVDGIDGEIARLRGLTSKFGTFIDAMLDRIGDLAMILGAAAYVSKNLRGPINELLIVVFLAVSGSLLVSYMHGRAEKDLGKHPAFFGRMPPLASRDMRLFILFTGSVLGFTFEALLAIAIITFTYILIKLVEIWKEWSLGRIK